MRVFVNSNPLDVEAGATAIDCVRQWKTDEAEAIASGRRLITDSRGLPIDASAAAHAGSIYRTVPNRSADARHE